jgi:hypothetical protein
VETAEDVVAVVDRRHVVVEAVVVVVVVEAEEMLLIVASVFFPTFVFWELQTLLQSLSLVWHGSVTMSSCCSSASLRLPLVELLPVLFFFPQDFRSTWPFDLDRDGC